MSKPQQPVRRRPIPRLSSSRRLHRWIGLASFVFVALFSLTGIALNHAAGLGLGERFVGADWLLAWYGISAPAPAASFDVDGTRLTQVGTRLYFDDRELARDVKALRGAVRAGGFYAAATADGVLLATPAGELADRIELSSRLPGPIEAIAAGQGHVILAVGPERHALDLRSLELTPLDNGAEEYEWAAPAPVDPALRDALAVRYRGPGITLERLLYDIHSGRLLGTAGTLLADLIGILLLVLAATGLILWFRRRI